MTSVYENIGGQDAVDAAVDIFYRKVRTDNKVKHFFDDVDMYRQIIKQKAFLTMAFGGPNNYTGKDLREAHSHLVESKGLNDEHFDIVASHLQSTLTELSVPRNLIDEVMIIVESTRDHILNR